MAPASAGVVRLVVDDSGLSLGVSEEDASVSVEVVEGSSAICGEGFASTSTATGGDVPTVSVLSSGVSVVTTLETCVVIASSSLSGPGGVSEKKGDADGAGDKVVTGAIDAEPCDEVGIGGWVGVGVGVGVGARVGVGLGVGVGVVVLELTIEGSEFLTSWMSIVELRGVDVRVLGETEPLPGMMSSGSRVMISNRPVRADSDEPVPAADVSWRSPEGGTSTGVV